MTDQQFVAARPHPGAALPPDRSRKRCAPRRAAKRPPGPPVKSSGILEKTRILGSVNLLGHLAATSAWPGEARLRREGFGHEATRVRHRIIQNGVTAC
jgi:hypothetical protein